MQQMKDINGTVLELDDKIVWLSSAGQSFGKKDLMTGTIVELRVRKRTDYKGNSKVLTTVIAETDPINKGLRSYPIKVALQKPSNVGKLSGVDELDNLTYEKILNNTGNKKPKYANTIVSGATTTTGQNLNWSTSTVIPVNKV